jgi:hypothetical protein
VSQFRGTYVFKQNGLEIGRSKNIITTNGRKMILEYLSGSRQNWAADMAIGAMPTNISGGSPTVSDTQLNFETSRQPVTLKSFISATTVDPDLIVVRATFPTDLYANIYEVGLYAVTSTGFSTSTRNNFILSDFSNLTYWNATSGSVTTNSFIPQGYNSPRIGANSIDIPASTTYLNSNLSIGFTNYTNVDSLQLLAFNTSAGIVTVTLTDVSGKNQNILFSTTNNTGYSVLSQIFDQNTSSSNYTSIINFNTITQIQVATDSSASLTLDAIKVVSANEISTEESIVSKSVLSTPIPKNPNIPLDVEYYVELL